MKRAFLPVFLMLAVIGASAQASSLRVQLQSIADQQLAQHHLYGMTLCIATPNQKGNSRVCVYAGKSSSKTPLSAKSLYQIGSITKSFTTVALLKLGKQLGAQHFNLDQTLGQWLPQYPDWRHVTIRQMLNMSGGIYNYTETKAFTKIEMAHPHKLWTIPALIKFAYQHQPNTYFSPGKGWHYSNTDYLLAGLLVEKLWQMKTGKHASVGAIINKEILHHQAHDLTNTHFLANQYPSNIRNKLLQGHADGKNMSNVNMSWAGAAGCMVASAADIIQWARLLYNSPMLPATQRQQLTSLVSIANGQPLPALSPKPGYGLGIFGVTTAQYGPLWFYTGGTQWFTTFYMYVPKLNRIIFIATGTEFNDARKLALSILPLLK